MKTFIKTLSPRTRLSKPALFLFTAFMIVGCLSTSPNMRHEVAKRLATPAFMLERQIETPHFTLTAFERSHNRGGNANIYIEGDGYFSMYDGTLTHKESSKWPKFLPGTLATKDPTPINPVALHLASKDTAQNVFYLGRPCQYKRAAARDEQCREEYWTSARFAPEIINSMGKALDNIKGLYGIRGFNLIGFDGGGSVAAILAAKRSDILSLRTIAANLDHSVYSQHHGIEPLHASLNPVDFAHTLQNIPQYHVFGGQDNIIPPKITHSYLNSLKGSRCVQYTFIQEAEHEAGWVDKWPELSNRPASCSNPPLR